MSQDLLWVYTHVYNEKQMLPFFLRHYLPMAEKVTVLVDPASDDGTQELLQTWPASNLEIAPWVIPNLDDITFVDFANEYIKGARSRFVMWPDADELLWHANMRQRLSQYSDNGIRVVRPKQGWVMSHDYFPQGLGQIYEYCRTGRHEDPNCKPIIVDPTANIRWAAGKHYLLGDTQVATDSQLWMLHFRFMGLQYHLDRNHRNWARIPEDRRAIGLGWQTNPTHDADDTISFNIRRQEDKRLPDDVAI